MISKSFNFFEVHEKNYITNLYLNLTCTYDIFINTNSNGKKTYSLGSFGEKKYAFIKSLPSNVLQKNNVLRREYQALFRKFGNIDHTKSLHSGITQSGVVGPPLSPSVYSKMTLNSWKNSMVKFNENYKSKHFLSG
ncbi:MAG: hypothetical protein LC122_14875, partial [Chitinophagales bacterium]|nr:hypothetical protein [Chitinophagales bacterium]